MQICIMTFMMLIVAAIRNTISNNFKHSLSNICRSVKTRSKTSLMENYIPWSNGYSINDLREMQMKESDISHVINWVQKEEKPSGDTLNVASPATRHYIRCWDALILKDGLLFRKFY